MIEASTDKLGAQKRSAKPLSEKKSLPTMMPFCTTEVRWPMSATKACHSRMRPGPAPLALNPMEVTAGWAIEIRTLGPGQAARAVG